MPHFVGDLVLTYFLLEIDDSYAINGIIVILVTITPVTSCIGPHFAHNAYLILQRAVLPIRRQGK